MHDLLLKDQPLDHVLVQGETLIKSLLSSLRRLKGPIDRRVVSMIQTAFTTMRQAVENHWENASAQKRQLELGIHYMKMMVDQLALMLQVGNLSSSEEE